MNDVLSIPTFQVFVSDLLGTCLNVDDNIVVMFSWYHHNNTHVITTIISSIYSCLYLIAHLSLKLHIFIWIWIMGRYTANHFPWNFSMLIYAFEYRVRSLYFFKTKACSKSELSSSWQEKHHWHIPSPLTEFRMV